MAAVLGGTLLLLSAAGSVVAQDLQPGEYRVSSRSSGMCLDAERGSRNAGSLVQQFDCHGGLNQRLRLLRFGDSWVFRAMHSDLCLAVDEVGVVTQADCDGSDRQFFRIAPPEDGDTDEYRISIGTLCLQEGHPESPYRVTFTPCSDGNNERQSWNLW